MTVQARSRAGDPTLADLLREVWRARAHIVLGCALGVVLASALILLAVPHSRAQMLLAPANPMSAQGHESVQTGQAQGETLRASDLYFERFQAISRGAVVASLMLRNPEIVAGLEADRAFSFSRPAGIARPEGMAEYIARRVTFASVGETPVRAMRYSHPDPAFASFFLQKLHAVTDGVIRHAVRREVAERISYLQQEAQKAVHPDHRRALTNLLLEQERLKMMASIDQPFAALVVEPAFSSSRPVWPDAVLTLGAFAAVGAFCGFVLFVVTGAVRYTAVVNGDAAEAQRVKDRLLQMRRWQPGAPGNTNQPPRGRGASSPFSSDAAE